MRLSKENEKRLENGELDVYELITRPVKKFEKSIMVAGVFPPKASESSCYYAEQKMNFVTPKPF